MASFAPLRAPLHTPTIIYINEYSYSRRLKSYSALYIDLKKTPKHILLRALTRGKTIRTDQVRLGQASVTFSRFDRKRKTRSGTIKLGRVEPSVTNAKRVLVRETVKVDFKFWHMTERLTVHRPASCDPRTRRFPQKIQKKINVENRFNILRYVQRSVWRKLRNSYSIGTIPIGLR